MSRFADVLIERLRHAGVRTLFGVPGGGGNLDLIEAARSASLPFVLTSTENGAAIAAIAQAEILGRPGACLTTLGPGAASVVNGIACAHLERAPLLVFTDSDPGGGLGTFSHQQIDHAALFASVTKWSGRLTASDATGVMDRAFREVMSLPPGPVHIDCPGDVNTTSPPPADASSANGPEMELDPVSRPDPAEALKFDWLAAHARKPLVIVGLGARRDADAQAIRHLCERWGVPAMVTYKAKGVVPDTHPNFAGVFTNGGIERAIIGQSDLLIGIGLDPVELLPRPWTFAQPVIGVNPWRMPVDHVPFAAQLVGDLPHAVAMLEAGMRPGGWDLDDIARTVHGEQRFTDIAASGMAAQQVVDTAAAALASTCRVTVDAGAHMLPVMMRWPVAAPNDLLISNGLSTMGFAVPAAIGAALADPGRRVVALTGDGGLLMCTGELLTLVREQLRVTVIVFNDASLSLIEIKQQARQLPAGGLALGAVNWAGVAENLGMAGFRASSEPELVRAIEQAAAVSGPSVIDATIDRSNYGRMLKAIRG